MWVHIAVVYQECFIGILTDYKMEELQVVGRLKHVKTDIKSIMSDICSLMQLQPLFPIVKIWN